MRKITVAAAALVTLFIAATQLNAEMRITPDEIVNMFVDPGTDSAALRLEGDYFCSSPDRSGAVIFGQNIHVGNSLSIGGYFIAMGEAGRAVYGRATRYDATNYGGYFEAFGKSGRGVYGEAAYDGSATNYGGYFKSEGSHGRGVYAHASGTSGIGVYARASNTEGSYNYGGHFTSSGTNGRGIYALAAGTDGRGIYGRATGAGSIGVWGEGKSWDFFADGDGGNYGAFTGAHEVKFSEEMPRDLAPGMIVSATGRTEIRRGEVGDITLSSTLPTVTLSTIARDKAVLGVFVCEAPRPDDHWYAASEGEWFGVVNALGEGRVWVTDRSGEIEAGDYITTSDIPGYGQRQADDLLHAYTLGKAIETIDWNQITETVQHAGKTYRRYLLAVVYTSG